MVILLLLYRHSGGVILKQKSLDTLIKRIKEAIELCLEVETPTSSEFIGVQKVAVNL